MNEHESNITEPRPRWYHRYAFWVILSALSAFFAEVCCGNEPFVLLYFEKWLLVVSMYGMHTLIFASIVCYFGRVTLPQLFFAGTVFGLYEAYMTKILWSGWEENAFHFAGIAVVETLILVLFWHPIMAFIIPLLIAERFLLHSSTVLDILPQFVRNKAIFRYGIFFGLPLITGAFVGAVTGEVPSALLSTAGCSGVLLLFFLIWRYVLKGGQFTLTDLLPSGWEFKILCGLLLCQYVFFYFAFNPDKMPGIYPQITIWVLYAFFISMLILSLKKAPAILSSTRQNPDTLFIWVLFCGVFIAAGFISASYFKEFRDFFFVGLFLVAVPVGCCMLVYTSYKTLKRKPHSIHE